MQGREGKCVKGRMFLFGPAVEFPELGREDSLRCVHVDIDLSILNVILRESVKELYEKIN